MTRALEAQTNRRISPKRGGTLKGECRWTTHKTDTTLILRRVLMYRAKRLIRSVDYTG